MPLEWKLWKLQEEAGLYYNSITSYVKPTTPKVAKKSACCDKVVHCEKAVVGILFNVQIKNCLSNFAIFNAKSYATKWTFYDVLC